MAEVTFNQEEPQDVEAMLQEKAMRFDRPIPGQSLTNDPDTPLPFEQPATYTNRDEALQYFFALFVDEENYPTLMQLIDTPFPIMDIVKIYLVEAFEEGLINPVILGTSTQPDIRSIGLNMRHARTISGGFHCVTLDTLRDGKREDYF